MLVPFKLARVTSENLSYLCHLFLSLPLTPTTCFLAVRR